MFDKLDIKRIVLDLSLKVTGQPFNGDVALYKAQHADWKYDLGLDSIELMELAAYTNSFFNLFEIKKPPYLLSSTKVDDWVDLISSANKHGGGSISFTTSGTSGQTKTVSHTVAYLRREAHFLASIFKDATYIVPYVPSHTIYGFLLTVCLPEILQVPIVYPSDVDWPQLLPGALIVSTPFHWRLLLAALPNRPLCCLGVSAASLLYDDLFESIASRGIALTELYGATETAGVASRQHWQTAFKLFPYWQLTAGLQVRDRETDEIFELMDDVKQTGGDTFILLGRKDKMINVAGRLVDLARIAVSIRTLPNIKECHISAKAIVNEVIIQTVLVLHDDGENQRAEIRAAIRRLLPSHERPRDISFGIVR